jgi:F-type H+-transporting ATPase subunit gamma
MTERLADISARIDGIRQLGAVVNAMRGIAAARARQARSQLIAIDSYTATIMVAIGQALAFVPSHAVQRPHCLAGVVRLELEYPCASHVFEMS